MDKKVIVVGSGKIAAGCINILSSQTKDVTVIETENQSLSCVRMISSKLGFLYIRLIEAQQITSYLETVNKDTLIVSANNNYIFLRAILKKKNFCIVNFHNALLPAYPGRNAPTWVIFDGEETTGVTWHIVGEGVDTGDILIQSAIPLNSGMTAFELTRLCMDTGVRTFNSISKKLLQGNFDCEKQDLSKREKYHSSGEIPNQGLLDVSWPLDKVSSFLRSLDYGGLSVLPPPKLVWAGNAYVIRKYRLESAMAGKGGMLFKKGEMVIQDEQRLIHMELERRMEHETCRRNLAGAKA